MPDDTQTIIENALAAPRKVKADGVEVEQQPLPDQIAAGRTIETTDPRRAVGGYR